MSSGKIRKLRSLFTSNGGGCGCGPHAADKIIEPKPVSKIISVSDQNPSRGPSSSDSFSGRHGGGRKSSAAGDDDEDHSSTTFSLTIDTSSPGGHYCPENQHDDHTKYPKIQNSIAVVKESDDPYRDFRRSMLQMIFEKEIYTRNDLQQLLDCFLQLNSPRYHKVIVRAFMEIWNGGIPATPPPCSST